MADNPRTAPDLDVWAVYEWVDLIALFTTEALASAYAEQLRDDTSSDGWDDARISVERIPVRGTLPSLDDRVFLVRSRASR